MVSEATPRDLESIEVWPVLSPADLEAENAAKAWVAKALESRRAIHNGEVFTASGHEFAIVACVPVTATGYGMLTSATKVSMMSVPIPTLSRVQLNCLQYVKNSSDLYQDHIRPLLLRKRLERKEDGGKILLVLAKDQVLRTAPGIEFGVRALDPSSSRYGGADANTEYFIEMEESPALAKVHVLPFEDSLPVAYRYSLFRDFLQPFFQAHPFAVYGEGDVFSYSGVRFRVMATDPAETAARVGTQTVVFFEGEPLRPTIWDLLPPELREDLQRLPRGLQMLLLNTMANEEAVRGRLTEVQEVMRRGRGLEPSDIRGCGEVVTWKSAERTSDTQHACMVCLSDFADGDRLRMLSCSHQYHVDCIDEWLRRSAACPVCKQPCGTNSTSSSSSSHAGGDTNPFWTKMREVVCSKGQGRVVGFSAEAKCFRIRLDANGQEEKLRHEDFVQLVGSVLLTGLNREDLNGMSVQIVGFDLDTERYQVSLDNGRVLAVKPEHCVLPEGVIARVVGLREDGTGGHWNGQYGRIVSFDSQRMRHVLAMQPRGQLLSVKAKNLRV